MAQHHLPEIAQAVLDVMRCSGAIDDIADTNDVQAMHLMDHRQEECSVVGAEIGEAVRGEECAPFRVVVEGEVRLSGLEGQSDGRKLERQLCGVIAVNIRLGGTVSASIRWTKKTCLLYSLSGGNSCFRSATL